MRKLKTYYELISESIRLKDHKILDTAAAEELAVTLSEIDQKFAEITPVNIREWVRFSEQLDLIYKIISDFDNQEILPPFTPAQNNANESNDFSYVQAYVLEKTNTEFKHSVFELMQDWFQISENSRKKLNGMGFYPEHIRKELEAIGELMKIKAKKYKALESIDSTQMHQAIEDLEDLDTKLTNGVDVLNGKFYNINELLVFAVKNQGYNEHILKLVSTTKFGATNREIYNHWYKINGYSSVFVHKLIDRVFHALKIQSENNKEKLRTAGMEDWYRVKTTADRNVKMLIPEMKAFMKSGKTKLYIDDMDSKYNSKYPQFPTDIANHISDIKFSKKDIFDLLNMFAMRNTDATLKVHQEIKISPTENHRGNVKVHRPMSFEAPSVEMFITEMESIQWLISNYKGGGWIINARTHGPYSHYDDNEFNNWITQYRERVKTLEAAGFTVKFDRYGTASSFDEYVNEFKEYQILSYRKKKEERAAKKAEENQ